MTRIIALAVALSGVALQAAADEIRHTSFDATLIGTWAQSADLCAKKDKSNFAISSGNYVGPDGACAVEVIIETAGSQGTNYSVRGRCTANAQDQPRVVNVIMREQGADELAIGPSFEDLKSYRRCPITQ